MRYPRFLAANAGGAVVWAGGTTAVIYYVGVVAESWLKRFSWLGLVAAVLVGLASMLIVRRKAKKTAAEHGTAETEPVPAAE
jgi:membrane protein DedA with SNARE-associated domain